MRTCEVCHAPILLDEREEYYGVNRTLCIWCEEHDDWMERAEREAERKYEYWRDREMMRREEER